MKASTLRLLLLPIFAVMDALIMSTMWGWFVVPLGAPEIGAAHALGLTLMLEYVTVSIGALLYTAEEDSRPGWQKVAGTPGSHLLVFAIAAAAHVCM